MLVLVVFVRALRQRSWKNFTQETVGGKNLSQTILIFYFFVQKPDFASMCQLAGHLQSDDLVDPALEIV